MYGTQDRINQQNTNVPLGGTQDKMGIFRCPVRWARGLQSFEIRLLL